MKKIRILLVTVMLLIAVCGCGFAETPYYQQITQEEAAMIMEGEEEFILLDVRTQEEYDEGHIQGAVCLPTGSIRKEAEELIPDKDMTILVYCRSGNRSKVASGQLGRMGYTDVREFGGINTWPGEIVTEDPSGSETEAETEAETETKVETEMEEEAKLQ